MPSYVSRQRDPSGIWSVRKVTFDLCQTIGIDKDVPYLLNMNEDMAFVI